MDRQPPPTPPRLQLRNLWKALKAKRQKRKRLESIQIIVNNVNIEGRLSFFDGENDFESHSNQRVKTKKNIKILYDCLIT